jgi:hypothetical protein
MGVPVYPEIRTFDRIAAGVSGRNRIVFESAADSFCMKTHVSNHDARLWQAQFPLEKCASLHVACKRVRRA